MKVKLLVVALSLGLFFSITSNASAVNLFTNADFSNGVNGWTNNVGYPFVGTDQQYRSAPYSAKNTVTNVSGEGGFYGQIHQEFNPAIMENEPVYMSAWLKTDMNASSTARAGIFVEFIDDSIPDPIVLKTIKTDMYGVSDWFQIFVTDHAPASTTGLRAGAFLYAAQGDMAALTSKVYVDDLFIDIVAHPEEPIVNTDFESLLSGWTTGEGTYPFSYTDTEKYSGVYSAYDSIDAVGAQDYYGFIYQEMGIYAGDPIYATAWAKSDIDAQSTAKGGLTIQFFDANNQLIPGADIKDEIGGQLDWQQLYVSGNAPTGAVKMKVGAFLWADDQDYNAVDGKFYIDDIVVSTEPLPPPEFQTQITNAGFEVGSDGWLDIYGLPMQIVEDGHASTYAAQKTIGETPDNDYYSLIYQDIYYNVAGDPFPADTDVSLTSYLKSSINPMANASVGIKLAFFDSENDEYTLDQDEINAINDWRMLYTAGTIPAGALRARVSGFVWAKEDDPYALDGTVNFDDFSYSYDVAPEPALSGELLNPDFENGLNDWDKNGTPATINDQVIHSGSYASKSFINNVSSSSYYSEIHQNIAVTPGKRVRAKVWAKTDLHPLAAAGAVLQVYFYDEEDEIIGIPVESDVMAEEQDWTLLELSTIAPSGVSYLSFSCSLSAQQYDPYAVGGSAYFDDAFLSITSGHTCLLKGTEVKLFGGTSKSIEEIVKGDRVMGVDKNGALVAAEVRETSVHPRSQGFLVIETEDSASIRVTPNHPVFNGRDYVEAVDLNIGDTVSVYNAKKEIGTGTTKIVRIKADNSFVDVYNIEVNDVHNYFAEGILVHNKPVRHFCDLRREFDDDENNDY